MIRCISYLALALATAGLSPVLAHGDENAKVKAGVYFEIGSKAYREARYQDAVNAFVEAYRLDPDPALVYNTGQAWEKLGNLPNALRAYRDYLRLAPDAPDRATVEAIIQNLETRLSKQEQSPDRAKNPDVELAPAAETRAATTQTSMDATPAVLVEATPAAASAPARPHPVHWWTYGALGTGVALAAGSGGIELMRRSVEAEAHNEPAQIEYKKLYDQVRLYELVARVLIGSGAVAAVVGGVLLFFDLSSSRDEAQTAATDQT